MSRDIKAQAHVAEGPLPVLVLGDLAPVRMANGKPGRLCEVRVSKWGYRKGQMVRVATALLSVPSERHQGVSASQRRKARAARQRYTGATKPERQKPVPAPAVVSVDRDRDARERDTVTAITGHTNVTDK